VKLSAIYIVNYFKNFSPFDGVVQLRQLLFPPCPPSGASGQSSWRFKAPVQASAI